MSGDVADHPHAAMLRAEREPRCVATSDDGWRCYLLPDHPGLHHADGRLWGDPS